MLNLLLWLIVGWRAGLGEEVRGLGPFLLTRGKFELYKSTGSNGGLPEGRLSEGQKMATTEEIVTKVLNFTEKEFFNTNQSVFAPRESRLLDMSFFGVAVNVPRQIMTASHDKLPLIMAIRCSGERGWEVPLKDNCIMVGMNLQAGTVRLANALVTEKELVSRGGRVKVPRGPKPPGLAKAAAQLTELEVRNRLDIKWNTGVWAFGVIYYDWPSNTVVAELNGDEPVLPSSARPVSPSPNRSSAGLPSYLSSWETPKFPDSGLAFTTEFGMEKIRQSLKIRGAFTVPARDFHIPREKVIHRFEDGRQENVAAVVPVTLVVVALDSEPLLQFDWAVPVYGQSLKAGMTARGCFAIDSLASGAPTILPPNKYFCYLIMEGKIFGPQAFTVPK